MKERISTDILIVGGGIVGLTIARELSLRHPGLSIVIIEKEHEVAEHASGRNSGVIHAGFYYTPDSLKARVTVDGNRLMTEYCLKNNLRINRCGKVVVAKNEKELDYLDELKRRGDMSGVDLKMVDENGLKALEPNAKTHKRALYSRSTSSVNPKEVTGHIAASLKDRVRLIMDEGFLKRADTATTESSNYLIDFKHLINTAGLYADKIAHQFDVGRKYTLIPFKGLYMEYKDDTLLKMHVYPVPDPSYPFLGVHFTCTVDGKIKIGPTAIPAFWRENYKGLDNFDLSEMFELLYEEMILFITNSCNFRTLTFEEVKKYSGSYLKRQASLLVREIDLNNFGGYLKPGIRAQLLDTEQKKLEMDFVVEHGEKSTHVLNAVSPAFTSSFSFAKFVADEVEARASC